jgi:hypothetical protein
MATEPFLINPPKKLKYRRRRRNPVGETLITIGANPIRRNPMRRRRFRFNAWFGHSAGHRRAAMARWGKRVGGRKRRAVRSYSRRRTIDRRTKAYQSMRAAQFKEAAGFLALTAPGKKRKFTFKGGQWVRKNKPYGGYIMRRRRVRRNTWFGQPRRHRRAAYKGWRRGHMIDGRLVRHYRKYLGNAPSYHRRSRRSYRRNPALSVGKFTSGIMNIGSWGPLAITGGLSAVTGALTPSMLGLVNPFAKLGAQVAVAVGGSMLVDRFVGGRHGDAWLVVGVSMVGYQLLKQFVLIPYLPQFAVGLGSNYNDYTFNDGISQQVGAFPGEMNAFPGEVSDYPGVGAYDYQEEEVGAYPYGD